MITERDVREAISRLNKQFDGNDFPSDVDFGEAGLDSLDIALLILDLHERFGLFSPSRQRELGGYRELNSINAIITFARHNDA